jgi:hypothetical protein
VRMVTAFLTPEGKEVLLALVVGGFVVGCAAGLLRMPSALRAAFVFVGPPAAFVAYKIINPEPHCEYDCIGKGLWVLMLGAAVVASWVGLAASALGQWLALRRGQRRVAA